MSAAAPQSKADFEIYQSATVINGNVAEGPYTTLTHRIDATVNGRWDYDLTDANPSQNGYTGHVTGGFHQIDLSGVAADARAAALAGSHVAHDGRHTILSLSGMTMNIGSINPDNIYWDFNGLGGDVSITSMAAGQTVYGNFLAPDRNILSDHRRNRPPQSNLPPLSAARSP